MKTTRPREIPRSPAFAAAWLAGISQAKMAEALGCGPKSLTYVAQQMGLPPRRPGRRKVTQ
jgi:hypothetical protein